jgi:hypothetical protein
MLMVAAGLVAACGGEDDSDQSSDSAKRPPRTCGNGVIDAGEQCDGTNLNGQTCETATMGARPGGTLSCSKSCTFNTKRCTRGGGSGGSGGMGGSGGASAGTGGV